MPVPVAVLWCGLSARILSTAETGAKDGAGLVEVPGDCSIKPGQARLQPPRPLNQNPNRPYRQVLTTD